MPKHLKTNKVSKEGINFIKTIVEKANCIFNETPQQNNLGIDTQIELIKNEIPTTSIIAVQIKSGNSYKINNYYYIPVENHYEYWKDYSLDVIGIVYNPKAKKAYWIDVKKYFENNGKVSKIYIYPNRINEFNISTFKNIIAQFYSNQPATISYSKVGSFLKSDNTEEFDIGLNSGFVNFSNKNEFWDLMVQYLFENGKDKIINSLLYYLSFATHGVDVWHSSRYKYKDRNLKYARKILKEIDKENIIKILSLVNSKHAIERDSVGSSIESIISNADNADKKLKEIIYCKDLDRKLRENAVLIYASHTNDNLLAELNEMKSYDKELKIDFVIELVKQSKKLYLYS